MSNIIISNDYIDEMDDLTLFLYTSTQMYMRHSIPYIRMPREKFYDDAFQINHLTKKQRENVDNALNQLQEYGLLDNGDHINIYPPKFKMPDGILCTFIDTDVFYSIFNSNYRPDVKWALFHYYCRLISSLDYNITIYDKKGVVGHMPQAFFMYKTGLSQQTISKYHKYLEDLQLIYTSRCKYNIQNGKRRNNYYGRYEDRKLIDKFVVST